MLPKSLCRIEGTSKRTTQGMLNMMNASGTLRSSIVTHVCRGGSRGGLWGLETPPLQTVLILKQALQIIILIGAKTVII